MGLESGVWGLQESGLGAAGSSASCARGKMGVESRVWGLQVTVHRLSKVGRPEM